MISLVAVQVLHGRRRGAKGDHFEEGSAVPDLLNRRVKFMLRDVYNPPAEELLAMLYGEQILEGTVVDESSSGDKAQAFVVVRLAGVDTPVVVPSELIRSISR